jgi:AGZA family xanthine/uracil permease-like MFS transporter
VCNDANDPLCMNNDEYALCVQDLNRSLITATAAIAGFSSVLFGFLTNMPVALAPGMGLNAYFAYQVVGFHGSGIVPYNLALTAVFIEGFIFIGLSLLGIPNSLKIATACGIGLFLSLIGLSSGIGIGAISGAKSTPLEIAGCADQYKDEFGMCTSHKMTSPTVGQTAHKWSLALMSGLAMDWTHVWRHYHRLSYDVQG